MQFIVLLHLICYTHAADLSPPGPPPPPKPPKLQLKVERKVDDHIYTIKVDIDNKPMELVLDTGSPFLWVANRSLTKSQIYNPPGYNANICNYCAANNPIPRYGYHVSFEELAYHNWQNLQDCQCPTQGCDNCRKSHIPLINASTNERKCSCDPLYQILYASGNITGYVVTDTIGIGPNKVNNYKFGVAMSDSTLLSAFASGVFGVGFYHEELTDFIPALDALFPGSSCVFSIYMGRCPVLLLGPPENWAKRYYYENDLIEMDLTNKYEFMIHVRNVGFYNDYNFTVNNQNINNVLIDSGTSFLVAPHGFDLDKAINRSFNCGNCVFKSKKWKGLWEINPKKIVPKDMPVLSIFYGPNQGDKWDLEWCYYIFTEKDINNQTHYLIGISTLPDIDFWILGDMFLSKYFVTFNKKDYKLSVAPAKGRVPITQPQKYCKENYGNCKSCYCDKFDVDEDDCVLDMDPPKDPCTPKKY